MERLCDTEFAEAGRTYLMALFGALQYRRWCYLQSKFGFSSQVAFVKWLMDSVETVNLDSSPENVQSPQDGRFRDSERNHNSTPVLKPSTACSSSSVSSPKTNSDLLACSTSNKNDNLNEKDDDGSNNSLLSEPRELTARAATACGQKEVPEATADTRTLLMEDRIQFDEQKEPENVPEQVMRNISVKQEFDLAGDEIAQAADLDAEISSFFPQFPELFSRGSLPPAAAYRQSANKLPTADNLLHQRAIQESLAYSRPIEKGTPDGIIYTCQFCNFGSRHRSAWYRHRLIHTDHKPNKCPYCDFACRQKHYLSVHMRKHTGEKPFSCAWCTYSTANKQSLQYHMKNHLHESMKDDNAVAPPPPPINNILAAATEQVQPSTLPPVFPPTSVIEELDLTAK